MSQRLKRSVRKPATLILLALLLWPAGTLAAQEETPEPNVYVVQRGDTLFDIAERFGTTVKAIVITNGIEDSRFIVPGQKLVIPTDQPVLALPSGSISPLGRVPGQRLHSVRQTETLPFLAFRYGTTVEALREVNEISRLGLLWPGQELTIPPALVTTASTPTFPLISAASSPVLQGRTMVIEVQTEEDLDLEGQFLDQDLTFVQERERYWALVGVDAMTQPGGYPLALTAVEVGSGDLLTMSETFTVTAGKFPTYNIVVSSDRQELLAPSVVNPERERLEEVFGEVSEERLWEGRFSLPLEGDPRISAPFGQRRSYGGGPVTSYHSGLDYHADKGDLVLAPITGTVVLAEPLQVRGKAVILDHGQGVLTGFWHLSEIEVTEGQLVGSGDLIGRVGSTGLSTGPHLHWELRVHGVPVNPVQWTRRAFP